MLAPQAPAPGRLLGNWDDSLTVVTPAATGQPASRESAINRVVNGQADHYLVTADGLAWYHETGPDAIANLAIPDPRGADVTTMTIRFTDIGQPQIISAPAHAIRVYGRG